MKKLKQKRKTCVKNVRSSRCKNCSKKDKKLDKLLKKMAFVSHFLSIYRSARALGWFEGLPTFKENACAALKILYEFIKKIL